MNDGDSKPKCRGQTIHYKNDNDNWAHHCFRFGTARAADLRTSLRENKKKRHLQTVRVRITAIVSGNVGNKRFTTKTETMIRSGARDKLRTSLRGNKKKRRENINKQHYEMVSVTMMAIVSGNVGNNRITSKTETKSGSPLFSIQKLKMK